MATLKGFTTPRTPRGTSSLAPMPPWHYVSNSLAIEFEADASTIASRLGIPAQVLGNGPLANIYFTPDPVIDYRSSLKSDSRLTQLLGSELLARGVLTNLAAKMYLSLAHSDRDIDTTLQAFEDSLKAITAGRR